MKRVVGIVPMALLSMALLASVAVGISLSRVPSLTSPSPIAGGAVGVPRAHIGDRWSIGMESTICLSRPGSVQITGVSPVKPDGLRVIDFGVRPNQSWKPTQGAPGVFLSELRAPLERFGFTGRTVDVACQASSEEKRYELAVRVLKTSAGPAVASGWIVTYRGSGRTGTLEIPFGLLLCPARSADVPRCPFPGS